MHWFFALLWGWGGPSVEGVPKGDVRAGTRKGCCPGRGRAVPGAIWSGEVRMDCGAAENSTGEMRVFWGWGLRRLWTASICGDNTISCALYLTHPTEGGTFTTA
jgi:hypothetical protein